MVCSAVTPPSLLSRQPHGQVFLMILFNNTKTYGAAPKNGSEQKQKQQEQEEEQAEKEEEESEN